MSLPARSPQSIAFAVLATLLAVLGPYLHRHSHGHHHPSGVAAATDTGCAAHCDHAIGTSSLEDLVDEPEPDGRDREADADHHCGLCLSLSTGLGGFGMPPVWCTPAEVGGDCVAMPPSLILVAERRCAARPRAPPA